MPNTPPQTSGTGDHETFADRLAGYKGKIKKKRIVPRVDKSEVRLDIALKELQLALAEDTDPDIDKTLYVNLVLKLQEEKAAAAGGTDVEAKSKEYDRLRTLAIKGLDEYKKQTPKVKKGKKKGKSDKGRRGRAYEGDFAAVEATSTSPVGDVTVSVGQGHGLVVVGYIEDDEGKQVGLLLEGDGALVEARLDGKYGTGSVKLASAEGKAGVIAKFEELSEVYTAEIALEGEAKVAEIAVDLGDPDGKVRLTGKVSVLKAEGGGHLKGHKDRMGAGFDFAGGAQAAVFGGEVHGEVRLTFQALVQQTYGRVNKKVTGKKWKAPDYLAYGLIIGGGVSGDVGGVGAKVEGDGRLGLDEAYLRLGAQGSPLGLEPGAALKFGVTTPLAKLKRQDDRVTRSKELDLKLEEAQNTWDTLVASLNSTTSTGSSSGSSTTSNSGQPAKPLPVPPQKSSSSKDVGGSSDNSGQQTAKPLPVPPQKSSGKDVGGSNDNSGQQTAKPLPVPKKKKSEDMSRSSDSGSSSGKETAKPLPKRPGKTDG